MISSSLSHLALYVRRQAASPWRYVLEQLVLGPCVR
jgi:hypothetical protein